MKNKFAAATLTGALALSGTAVAEAAPVEKDTTATETTGSAKTDESGKTTKEKWEAIKDQVGETDLSSGAGIAAQAGLVTTVFAIAAMIAAFNKVELTWPGDPHHVRI